MNILKTTMLCVVVGTALCAVADAPVAVRVEIESLAVEADGTRVALTVQVSPEDRSRIGKNAMLRILLDGDVPPGQSPLWGVRIESDGSGRVETVWPAGEHALRVEISSPNGENTGLWVGTVRIPGAEPNATAGEIEKPEPQPVPTPAVETADVAAAAAGPAVATLPELVPEIEEPVMAAAPDGESSPDVSPPDVDEAELPEPELSLEVETDPVDEPDLPQTSPEAGVVVEVVEEDVSDLEAVAPDAVAGAAGAAAATVPETPAEPTSEEAVTPGSEPPAEPAPEAVAMPESEPLVEPVEVPEEPGPAVVEPLRADTAPSSPPPGTAAAPTHEIPTDSAEPPPAEVTAAFEEWVDADPATTDVTVVVFRGNEPATDLTAVDFRVRIDGKDAVIEAVGDADRAPLQLGVAVDVASGSAAGWSQSGGPLFSLVQRARGGRGHVFFATDGSIGVWDAGPADSRGGKPSVTTGGLTSLIVDSLGRFEGRRGRAFLVVVTDGRSDADKASWKTAADTAKQAGVPVLVIALWDDNFSHRIRKNLKTIADTSGGGLFLVQGSDQLDRAAERFGPMIDAGVALRLLLPPGVVLPASVLVEAAEESLEVTAPRGVR